MLFANGNWDDHAYRQLVRSELRPGDLLIAADGGAKIVEQIGLQPHIVVGDLDSLDRTTINRLIADGVEIVDHPAGDDATDLELAMSVAVERGVKSAVIAGAIGSRLDHSLAGLLLLAEHAAQGLDASLLGPEEKVYALGPGPGRRRFSGRPGLKVSLVPLTPTVAGVTTANLLYPLSDACLHWGSTYSISNEMTADNAAVAIRAGRLLIFVEHGRVEGTPCASGC